MKFLRLLILFFAASVTAKSEARPVKAPRTVLDYFDLLPKRFFEIEYDGMTRRKWLNQGLDPEIPADNRSVIDIKHDFLRFPGDGAQSRLDIAVFRYRGQATVGVYTGWDAGELSFWRFQNGGLKEVTEQVLPQKWPKKIDTFDYLMPRIGTSIRVFRWNPHVYQRTSAMKPLYLLKWHSGRFVIGAKPKP